MKQDEIKKILLNEADEKYKEFSSKLLPETTNIIGVRLPVLRNIAKQIYKTSGTEMLKENSFEYFEEKMLKGMLIGLIKKSPEEILFYVKNFVPQIDNWSVCDSFCCGLKFIKGNEDKMLNFIKPYIYSKKEFEVRFAVVILLNYYINDKYIDKTLELLDEVRHEGYYAKMGAAWAISICFTKYPEKTEKFLMNTKINPWIFNKALQKIKESYKVDIKTKKKIAGLKKI